MGPPDWSHFDYELGMKDYEFDYGLDMIVDFHILFFIYDCNLINL